MRFYTIIILVSMQTTVEYIFLIISFPQSTLPVADVLVNQLHYLFHRRRLLSMSPIISFSSQGMDHVLEHTYLYESSRGVIICICQLLGNVLPFCRLDPSKDPINQLLPYHSFPCCNSVFHNQPSHKSIFWCSIRIMPNCPCISGLAMRICAHVLNFMGFMTT